ncbi:MAG: hypothetical protein R3336_00950, partial [Phycisphaeraceae bacterium]|nr:hypothetical protein [Phycisphaeraceae bacterium]
AVAAMLLLGMSILFPVLAQNRERARQIVCANRLAAAGRALGAYAVDHKGVLPRAGTWPGEVWWEVGTGCEDGKPYRSNSAHLRSLVRAGYLNPADLACPDNPNATGGAAVARRDWPRPETVSFSYQNQFTPEPIVLEDHAEMAVLADRNPYFDRGPRSGPVVEISDAMKPTRQHQSIGQNILAAAGHVGFHRKPMIGQDAIWTITGTTRYRGVEYPTRPGDSFLVP